MPGLGSDLAMLLGPDDGAHKQRTSHAYPEAA
jgi:hypothetical protein